MEQLAHHRKINKLKHHRASLGSYDCFQIMLISLVLKEKRDKTMETINILLQYSQCAFIIGNPGLFSLMFTYS